MKRAAIVVLWLLCVVINGMGAEFQTEVTVSPQPNEFNAATYVDIGTLAKLAHAGQHLQTGGVSVTSDGQYLFSVKGRCPSCRPWLGEL